MAIPGVFAPVEYRGHVLVDGGLINPLPYDVLQDACDLTIAVDVQGRVEPRAGTAPTYFETTFNSLQIMAATITRARLDARPPDIYVAPDIRNIRVLDFHRFEDIFRQAQPAKAALKRELRRRLG
jgi:NTE family protein